jgi:hypothetical protein
MADLPHPVGESTRRRVLLMEQRDEALSRRQQLVSARKRVASIPYADACQVRPRRACVP